MGSRGVTPSNLFSFRSTHAKPSSTLNLSTDTSVAGPLPGLHRLASKQNSAPYCEEKEGKERKQEVHAGGAN